MSVTCQYCGKEGPEKWASGHQHWCGRVERLVERAKAGEKLEPHEATTHQFCEALNRLAEEGEQ